MKYETHKEKVRYALGKKKKVKPKPVNTTTKADNSISIIDLVITSKIIDD